MKKLVLLTIAFFALLEINSQEIGKKTFVYKDFVKEIIQKKQLKLKL